ncbi:MAG: hypothetical protein ABI847_02490 [Anaerolineales bacterium]
MSGTDQPDSKIQPVKQIQMRPARPPRGWAYPPAESGELQAPSASMPWPAQLVFWTGIAAIVAASLGLQICINGLGRNPAETVLVLVSVVIEFGLLWMWNRKFPAFWTRVIIGSFKRLLR